MALARLEHYERADTGRRHRVAARDLRGTVDDRDPRALADLMIPEDLPRLDAEHDRAGIAGVQHRRRPDPLGRVDLEQVPRLHTSTIAP